MGLSSSRANQLQTQAKKIKQARNQSVKAQSIKISNLLNQAKLKPQIIEKILNSTVVELVSMLNQYQITSYQLVLVFAYRSSTIGLEYQMITETNFQKAIQLAQECDKIRRKSKLKNWTFQTNDSQFLPPLFGIPMSIKDTIDQKGFSSTVGVIDRYSRKQAQDGFIVQIFNKAGLIIFVRSNIPQLAMTYESVNSLWGRALNPWDKTRGVGGSSGGQGALIASRCSPIGVGSDIGGSIRIPAEFCGIYSLKPSSKRISFHGHTYYAPSFAGQINIPPTMGPLGKSVQDLALWMKLMTDLRYYKGSPDPHTKIIPFQDDKYRNIPKKMKIGYIQSLNFIQSSVASQRAVRQVVNELKKQGHQLIKIQIPFEKQLIGIFFEVIFAQGGLKGYKQMLKGQQLIQQYKLLKVSAQIPLVLYNPITSLLSKLKPRLGFLMAKSKEKSAYELLLVSGKQYQLRNHFISMWNKNQLDIIIAPGFGSQAQLHGISKQAAASAAYSFIWNVLDMTAGIVPVTKVREDQQIYQDGVNDEITQKLRENAKNSKGLPVGVQVIGLPFEQQLVLGSMKLIQNLFPFYKENKFSI